MKFQCTFCKYLIDADDDTRGLPAQCPSCNNAIMVPSSPFEEGCVIADFVIKEKIGTGSIGTVYKAEQLSLGRTVALKILSPQYTNRSGAKEFLKEARAAAKLSHPNLVQSLAVGSEGKICYMAMNYINGETVKDIIKRDGAFDQDEALHMIQQVAEALHYAWTEAGLVHRDVKPENMMVTEDGVVKLTDLGLAMPESEWKEGMKVSGSPSYMSPEQFAGQKLDCRSDIYSLGVSLYQMLSGELPFKGDTLRTIAKQHFNEPVPQLHKLGKKILPEVSYLVIKMMAKKPEDRFKDMDDLLKHIWLIRQRTAPDKELVPDVHTISIQRLDYTRQHHATRTGSGHATGNSSMQEMQQLKSTNRYLGLLLLVLTLIVSLSIVWTIFAMDTPNPRFEEIMRQTKDLKAKTASGELTPDIIQTTAEKLSAELQDFKKTPEEEILYLELRIVIYEAEVTKLKSQLAQAAAARTGQLPIPATAPEVRK